MNGLTGLLWVAFGMTAGAAALYGALGLTRPLDRTYLSFACIMALLCTYLYFELELYRATTSDAAVEAMRHQLIAAHGFVAGILVFVPSYTKVQVPRWVLAAFWAGLALLFVANLWAPYGVWFSSEPEITRATFRGEPYSVAIAPSLGPVQYVHTLYVVCLFVLAFTCALVMVRRGGRQRGLMLAIALTIAVVEHLLDVVRDAVDGSWPYVAEFGLVTWGLIMSIQLAIDFRNNQLELQATLRRAEQHAADLARMVAASVLVRDKLNTPLQILELDIAMCTPTGPDDERTLGDIRRAITELTMLGRNVEQAAKHSETALVLPERVS
jgi:hypothetical protein